MPESFNVLVKEIRSLAIDIDLDALSVLLDSTSQQIYPIYRQFCIDPIYRSDK